jgi:membrane-bound lytic murein transglycosylase B
MGLSLLATPPSICAQTQSYQQPSAAASPGDEPAGYAQRADVQQWLQSVAARQDMPRQSLQQALQQARFVPQVLQYISPARAGRSKDWALYRSRFIDEVRIRAGVAFWRANEAWLMRAQDRFGVPAHIVVGIVGVETIFGQQTGNFRVLDSLTTLSFDGPAARQGFFKDELEAFLTKRLRSNASVTESLGSFAGAMGWPQFMPSSVARFALDMDEDGKIDLHRSPADIIGSVANYLAQAGWQREWPTHFNVAPPVGTSQRTTLLGPDITPLFSPQEFEDLGALLPQDALNFNGKLALVELQNGRLAPTYVAGTSNFYVVTRYNRSSYYAMAVIELGTAVFSAVRNLQAQSAQKTVSEKLTLQHEGATAPETLSSE